MACPIGVKFVGFPKAHDGPENVLNWCPGAPGHLNLRDAPVLIRALAVGRLGIADQAQRTLAKLAGRDLGPEPGPWREWWAAECRSRGLPEPRPPKPGRATGAPVRTSMLRGWQIVLIQLLVVAALIFLCATQEPPMQVAVAACALALLVILALPRLFDVRRERRRRTDGDRDCCRSERRR
jgi:hypothetical protein